jgi:chromosomal replication initiator protein
MSGPLLDDVIDCVAHARGLKPSDLVGPSLNRTRIAPARKEAMRLCRELTNHSYPRIGVAFNRDHTTVIYAVHGKKRR